jgi:hypothetical protein
MRTSIRIYKVTRLTQIWKSITGNLVFKTKRTLQSPRKKLVMVPFTSNSLKRRKLRQYNKKNNNRLVKLVDARRS